ncbi:hypothetical protein [Arenimonas sp.]|uniref:dioxygenase family protein n=1 Tax=Arenimonas sp. TaxID=1872635 RepID=UPI0039E6CE43
MRAWLICLLLLLLSTEVAAAGIARWDALPAVDVEHLQGPYAGRNVCPMCMHGYDAGMLLFLPVGTKPADAHRIARAMQATSASIGDPRFRPFLVFTGGQPSPALLAAVKGGHDNWYVGVLPPARLAEFSRDFRRDLDERAWGYVFSQRRLLLSFEPLDGPTDWPAQLGRTSAYAMQFLRATYATAVAKGNPDTPKGALWSAPMRLDAHIAFTKNATERRPLCFGEKLPAGDREALVGVSSSSRRWWARTDAQGCVELQGAAPPGPMRLELFRVLQPTAHWQLDDAAWREGRRIDVSDRKTESDRVTGREPIVGLPCENCELVFRGLPAQIPTSGRIAPANEPGQALRLSGTVRDTAGRPRAGIVVYAYQTDNNGEYPRMAGIPHGRLRGWARSDAQGRYELLTIRPAGYPGARTPQHIHMHVIEPGRCTYYLGDVLFDDDPRLTDAHRRNPAAQRGGNGVVRPTGDARSGWKAVRDIALGQQVSGYAGCGAGTGRDA